MISPKTPSEIVQDNFKGLDELIQDKDLLLFYKDLIATCIEEYNSQNREGVVSKLKECFLDKNIECDGGWCVGCWKDIVRESIKMLEK